MFTSRLSQTGAEPILDHEKMLGAQERILGRIILHIYDIANQEATREAKTSGPRDSNSFSENTAYQRDQRDRRPHQVFLIDGARGSGKTTLLLTVQQFLRYLGRSSKMDRAPEGIPKFFAKLERQTNENVGAPSEGILLGNRFRRGHQLASGERITAFCLPVLFPSDLEFQQSIMEGILALIVQTLEADIERCKKQNDSAGHRRQARAEELRNRANEKVAQGWFLSRNTGHEAILRDSADYEDFLKRRGQANVSSFTRVQTWRNFINDYLNFFNAELLAVFFDDTDVATHVSKDILHSIRIFLDHPRVVTLIAGNLHSMRQSLILDEMRNLGEPIGALTHESEATALAWRNSARQNIEESLEKVLPRQFRNYIPASVPSTIERPPKSGSTRETDFRRIFGDSFDKVCSAMLDRWRAGFLETRHTAHFRYLADRQEVVDDQELGKLEQFMSWWLLRHWYADYLLPRSARHMVALRAYTTFDKEEKFWVDRLENQHRKRLAVILFESPDNYELIHRFSDADDHVGGWLKRQTLKASWTGERYISINGRKLFERTYGYQYIFFRLDLGIALPIQENPNESLPRGLLPVAAGPNLINHRPFFPHNRRQKLFGVAADLAHTTIPANCIFLSDADALPDAAWEGADTKETLWDHKLIYHWPRLFSFDLDEMRLRDQAEDRSNSLKPVESEIDEAWIQDYFVRTVIPLAAVSAGRFIGEQGELSEFKRDVPISLVASKSLLKAELDSGSQFFQGTIEKIGPMIRRFDYLEKVAQGPTQRGVAPLAEDILADWSREFLDQIFPLSQPYRASGSGFDIAHFGRAFRGRPERTTVHENEIARHIVSYQWLINDVRRAWHAARIFVNQISTPLKRYSAESSGEGAAAAPEVTRKDRFFREDRYTIGTRAALDRWLKRSDTLTGFLHTYASGRPIALTSPVSDDGRWVYDELAYVTHLVSTLETVVRLVDPSLSMSRDLACTTQVTSQHLRALLLARRMNDTHPWPFFLDPSPHPADASKRLPDDDLRSTYGRIARCYLLFLYGFAPTLPALIHVEVAATMKHFGQDVPSGRQKASSIINDWIIRIKGFVAFIEHYRTLLEFTKIRLDVMQLWTRAYPGERALMKMQEIKIEGTASLPEAFGIGDSLTPDMSFASIGIRGLELVEGETGGWGVNFAGDDLADLRHVYNVHLDEWGKNRRKNGRIVWQPIVADVRDHLVEALNFAEALKRVVEGYTPKSPRA